MKKIFTKITLLLLFGVTIVPLFAEEKSDQSDQTTTNQTTKPDQTTKSESAKIDLVKQPWLVERANLPAGMNPPEREYNLWANSIKFKTIKEVLNAPIQIEYWANEPPKDFAGKFVLIEFWATWCPACRRNLPLLEFFQEKYKKELTVISICETGKEELEKMTNAAVKFADMKVSVAVDTKRRFKDALGVTGIPHAVLIEPINGTVLWEGMPTQINYELTDEKLGKILANLKNPKIIERLPKTAPFEIKIDKDNNKKTNEQKQNSK
ncbi:MAG: TlpA family protein disulfide reductase [Planctomycetaceae bacterium]|jgi:thiol-disulfide isomerase/thioredoxin|nr:TlpA family protein disulfide reductase [Planctomycetaceae bacterium]